MTDRRTKDQLSNDLATAETRCRNLEAEVKRLSELADANSRLEHLRYEEAERVRKERDALLREKNEAYGEEWRAARTREFELQDRLIASEEASAGYRGALIALTSKAKADEILGVTLS